MSSNHSQLDGKEAYAQVIEEDERLAALNQEDPVRYRQLHEQALNYLNAQLIAGNHDIESVWTAVYERLTNLYFARDTTALLQLTTSAESIPLQSAQARNMRQYFQGVAFFRKADYATSLDVFTDLLTQPDLDTHLQARALNSRAVVCRVTGQLEDAMAGYRASLAVWQALGDDHYQGIVTLNLGIISYNLRRYDQADAYLRQAERFFEVAGSADWLAKTQSELGLVQRDLGHWDEALAYLETYIARSEQQESWEDVGVGEINRGEIRIYIFER